MAKATGIFSDEARARISSAVRRVENSSLPGASGGGLGATPYWEPAFLIGKVTVAITKGTSGTVQIYRGTTKGSETHATGDDVTAYARVSDISTGKWVIVSRINGGYEVTPWECP